MGALPSKETLPRWQWCWLVLVLLAYVVSFFLPAVSWKGNKEVLLGVEAMWLSICGMGMVPVLIPLIGPSNICFLLTPASLFGGRPLTAAVLSTTAATSMLSYVILVDSPSDLHIGYWVWFASGLGLTTLLWTMVVQDDGPVVLTPRTAR